MFLIQEMLATPLPKWESFYVIIGSSAGALTGLQFVVMALVADMRRHTSFDTIDAFGTPTIVHFCVVLALSGILSAPWPSLAGPAFILALAGVVGIGYVAIVTMRARRQKGYVRKRHCRTVHDRSDVSAPALCRDPQRMGHCDVSRH